MEPDMYEEGYEEGERDEIFEEFGVYIEDVEIEEDEDGYNYDDEPGDYSWEEVYRAMGIDEY